MVMVQPATVSSTKLTACPASTVIWLCCFVSSASSSGVWSSDASSSIWLMSISTRIFVFTAVGHRADR